MALIKLSNSDVSSFGLEKNGDDILVNVFDGTGGDGDGEVLIVARMTKEEAQALREELFKLL